MNDDAEQWTVFVVPSSHNDIGWAGTPSEVAEHRVKIIGSALALVDDPDAGYRFSMETALYLKEYLDRKPEDAALLGMHLRDGHLEWGAAYVQTYEGLQTEEGLLRQFSLGRRILEEAVGYRATGYWNVDVVARTLQLPQVLRHVGVSYAALSRNRPGIYWWEAPDGSRALTFNYWEGAYGKARVFDSYKQHLSPLESDGGAPDAAAGLPALEAVRAALDALADEWSKRLDDQGLPHGLAVVLAADYTVPGRQIVDVVRRFNQDQPASGRRYELRLGTVREYLEWVKERSCLERVPVERGEVPNPWVYQQPGHWETVAKLRAGQEALVAAEAVWSLVCLRTGSWASFPGERLRGAWEDALYPDHGYGGLHGEGTDAVFQDRVDRGFFTGRGLVLEGLAELTTVPSAGDGAGHDEAEEVIVFNSNSWPTSDWVEVRPQRSGPKSREQPAPVDVVVLDATGRSVDHQVLGGGPHPAIGFITPELPAVGFARFYVSRRADAKATARTGSPVRSAGEDIVWEADGVMARVTGGGLAELRVDGTPLISSDRYLAGEVLQFASPGVDVGDHERDDEYDWRIVRPFQPEVDGPVRPVAGGVDLVQSGPLRWVVQSVSQHPQCRVVQQFMFYAGIPRIDLRATLESWTGEHGRELRWVFPLSGPAHTLRYGVPFGYATLGEDEVPEFRESRPREFLRWLLADMGKATLALSSPVSTFDWSASGAPGTAATDLQLVLLATKRSIHPRGNWYSQEGPHTFRASLHPKVSSPNVIEREARQAGSLWSAVQPGPCRAGRGVTPENPYEGVIKGLRPAHVVVTAIKKQERTDALVVRLMETAGAQADVKLTTVFPLLGATSIDGYESGAVSPEAHLEGAGTVAICLRPHQIATLSLVPGSAPAP